MDDLELKLLMTPVPMTEYEKEFRAWLKDCKSILEGRTVFEVAELAFIGGFDRETVYKVLASFKDAMNGTQLDSRAAFQMWHWEQACEEARQLKAKLEKKTDHCAPLWKDLHEQQTGEAV